MSSSYDDDGLSPRAYAPDDDGLSPRTLNMVSSDDGLSPSAAHLMMGNEDGKLHLVDSGSEDEPKGVQGEGRKPLPPIPEVLRAFQKFYLAKYVSQAANRIGTLNEKRMRVQDEIKNKGLRRTVSELITSQKQLQDKFNAKLMRVPILRTKDKVSFVLGIALLMIIEYILIALPQRFTLFYASMLIPLMVRRFFTFHKTNFHYFMLDFCYYVQIWAILVIIYPDDVSLFKIFFGLCNGPLLMAVIMWQNKLVFHDLEKLTTLFIHIFPPLVSYTMRWQSDLYKNIAEEELTLTYRELGLMVLFYILWQVFYFIKTEWLDATKFQQDKTLMSSARWLSSVQPHPIYTAVVARGWKVTANQVLIPMQLIYTIITLFPVIFMFKYERAHLIGIILAFAFSSWFAASYYFESFTDNYTKRLEEKISQFYESNQLKVDEKKKKQLKYFPSSSRSVVVFGCFFVVVLVSLLGLIQLTIWS